jgi:predicted HTH transcriptional regulator
VVNSDIFIGLIGKNYGKAQIDGVSASEYEFDLFRAGPNSQNTFMFILKDFNPNEATEKFINKARLATYKRFDKKDLIINVQKSLDGFFHNKIDDSIVPFDLRIVHASDYSDIDENKVKEFLKHSLLENDALELMDDIKNTLLNKLKVIHMVDGEIKLNNTAILFFSKCPEKYIPQNEIRMVRFRGVEKTEII